MAFGIIVVDKKGTINKKQLNSVDQLKDIYKKCCTSRNATAEEYPKLTTWEIIENNKKIYIDLYGKQNGRAGFENKYELPPPVDKLLLFNSFALVKYTIENDQKQLKNLTPELWKKYYDELMGGFEDLNGTDESEEDELENIPKKFKTKNGYLKDGFVVDNEDDEDDDDDADENSDDDEDEDDDDENRCKRSNSKNNTSNNDNDNDDEDEFETTTEESCFDENDDSDDENMEFEEDDDENDNELTYEDYSESDSEE
jgi:hypothetical protein